MSQKISSSQAEVIRKTKLPLTLLSVTLSLSVCILGEKARPTQQRQPNGKSLSRYQATPMSVVEKMLALAEVRRNELVYDLGSGDGRIVIMAARKFGARGVGIELDPRRVRESLERIRALGLGRRVKIIEGDILTQDLSAADVVTIYMDSSAMETLRPHLEKSSHRGMRVVVCDAKIVGWNLATSVMAYGEDHVAHNLYLYKFTRRVDPTFSSQPGLLR